MSKRGNGYDSENRVNILKKVKIGKTWNLNPAVVEPNGKLRAKVRVRGKIEVHPEGYYYIENGYCESFNGKLRDECLNGEIFYSLKEAQIVIEKWRVLYNTLRPHPALGYGPPAPAACNPWVPNPNSQPMAVI